MEIREIFDTIESDPNMDEELQRDILKKIENIANADKLVDGLELQIEQHKDELSEKELRYIINKCISYKSVFYKFRNGKIVDYDHINEITQRIFQLEESIRKDDFSVWKEELLAYKGSKEDKEEDKMLKNMLMVVPEESNVVDKVTRMFKRAMWKFQQKMKERKNDDEQEVIELPQATPSYIDINLDDDYNEEEMNEVLEEQKEQMKEIVEKIENGEEQDTKETEKEVTEENIEKKDEPEKETEATESVNEENTEELVEKEEVEEEPNIQKDEEPVKRVRKGSHSNENIEEDNQQSTNRRRGSIQKEE